ncbi:thiol peroxidase [Mycoplasma sp. ES3157-GEN-MYC]|uniref:Thiol peroxidase n=1 Tax=Mycoplasma miroungigenitalium TaxID=754515 RepID=A0A6M4J8N8_9MOLU|nr:thiol peroxidase [Mycoplasma miroungigenitalium]MBU4690244.1 thiol peroxidase [Mycoplasma miroungigenitalium]MBU4691511.1 thiol peroxidase [Mycoplasma miroungigenitalium]QJR43344.1 thiol peroxidase [Mycoplasma miroungigenitalium]
MKVNFKSKLVELLGKQINVGDKFPTFKAVNLDLSDFNFEDLPKSKKLVISIPSIDTGVCEMETTKFMNYFKNLEYPVLAISCDLPFAFDRWCVAHDNKKVIPLSEFRYNDFGLKTGTKLDEVGLLTRAVFVLDENNKVLHVEYVKEVSTEPNYEKVYEFFK